MENLQKNSQLDYEAIRKRYFPLMTGNCEVRMSVAELITLVAQVIKDTNETKEEDDPCMDVLSTRLSVFCRNGYIGARIVNVLHARGIENLEDVAKFGKTGLLKVKGFSKKSLTDIDNLFESLDLVLPKYSSI